MGADCDQGADEGKMLSLVAWPSRRPLGLTRRWSELFSLGYRLSKFPSVEENLQMSVQSCHELAVILAVNLL